MKNYRTYLGEDFKAIHEQEKKALKESKEPLTEGFKNWAEVYQLFTACADRFFPDEEKVREAAQQVYEIFKGDPAVEEAWKRWNDTDSVKEYEETDESLTEAKIDFKVGDKFKETKPNGTESTITILKIYDNPSVKYKTEEPGRATYTQTQYLSDLKRRLSTFTKVQNESLTEDTVKQDGKWVNKGKEGTHGKFKTKKEADKQRAAIFSNGFKK